MHQHSLWRSSKPRRFRAAFALALVATLISCSYSNPWPQRSTSQAPRRAANPDDGYLRRVGSELVDSAGHPVKLVGVSWFGLETGSCALHGLSVRNWRDMLDQISGVGFNVLRLPYSNRFLDDPTCVPTGIDYVKNPDLKGLEGLAMLDRIVGAAGRRGLKVILDRHSPAPGTHGDFWYTEQVPESQWIDDWVMLGRHYRGNRAVIGADLDNELHGATTWGDGNPPTDWRLAAERAGNAILSVNPAWLIFVQGIETYHGDAYWWGGNLEGAGEFPVRLSHPDKLVYSPHDYGPSVSEQPWFTAPDFPNNLAGIWQEHWAYLGQQNTAALVLGEFGGPSVGQDVEGTWQRTLIAYLNANGIGYWYWAWNPNSGNTGGILQDDWKTLNQSKLQALQAYEWPRRSASSKR